MRLIDADKVLDGVINPYERISISRWLDDAPKVDAVPVEAYRQVQWERDIAMQQLDALGYGLGEKVVPVVRCKDCKNSEHWYGDRRRCFLWSEDGVSVFDDGFCNYAQRKE